MRQIILTSGTLLKDDIHKVNVSVTLLLHGNAAENMQKLWFDFLNSICRFSLQVHGCYFLWFPICFYTRWWHWWFSPLTTSPSHWLYCKMENSFFLQSQSICGVSAPFWLFLTASPRPGAAAMCASTAATVQQQHFMWICRGHQWAVQQCPHPTGAIQVPPSFTSKIDLQMHCFCYYF